ncbi:MULTISPECIES: hypothetical protein [unclassified Idiomarina]|mgnify:CR=1 FL=1|uniref:hypothetical protein n=1 Tax=unclassified Idiomarina TaxID=2614829 RepID=UPI000C914881|nr:MULTISPECIES: hypothetical protein [unclassified Idiomarina]MAD53892.1 hypothetical protein [Idiomarinaceae bacterium]MEC7643732.1 hypothetical protein [Pseudomonadota bacterium]NQZ04060.1 hypothetical protein [Idiomarina sp.]
MKHNALPKHTLSELMDRFPAAKLQRLTRLAFKRLLRFLAAAALLVLMYSIWNIATNQAQQQLERNTRQQLNFVLEQTASAAQVFIANGNQEGLRQLATSLENRPSVLSVALKSATGVNELTIGESYSVIDYPAPRPEPWIFIQPIGESSLNQGYLQVIFDKQQVLRSSQQTLVNLTAQGKTLLLLALVTGGMIVLGFNRIRDRRWVKKQRKKYLS